MYRNPEKVEDLKKSISIKEKELNELKARLSDEQKLVPVGYELISPGGLVKEGALCRDPLFGIWRKAGNSIGKKLNGQGYVSGIAHSRYLYANPL